MRWDWLGWALWAVFAVLCAYVGLGKLWLP